MPDAWRVGTDTDGTPIGTCWGRDIPDGWGWRRWENEDWRFSVPPHETWVQCRPPASHSDPAWIATGGDFTAAVVHKVGEPTSAFAVFQHGEPAPIVAQRVADALNAAESSATRPEVTVEAVERLISAGVLVEAGVWDRVPGDEHRVSVYYEDEDRPDDAPPLYRIHLGGVPEAEWHETIGRQRDPGR